MSIELNPLLPAWIIASLIAALFGALVYGTLTMVRRQVPRKWAGILTGLRLAIALIFTLILLHPSLSFTSSESQLPELMVLVDTSRSMEKTSDSDHRLAEVTDALRKGELAASLRSNYRLHWFSFDSTALARDESDLAALKPTGSTTDFANSMTAACNHLRALGKNPQHMLLVSDGNDRGPADPVECARRFGVTVDVLAPSAPRSAAVPEIAIAEVQSARRVLLGSDTHFRVTLDGKQPAKADRSIVLRVTEDGKKILEQPLVMKAGRTEQTLVLAHRPGSAGLKQYEFQLVTGQENIAKPYPLSVQVLDSKYEVLILEDRWRWEYKYLHRLFEDDPSFRFSALLARGGGTFAQFGSSDRRVNLVGFPQNRADLEGFDTFVLGDVNPTHWPRALASDLARLVTDEGKSLVVIAGPSLANLLEIPELHRLLPVDLMPESGKPEEGPIDVRLRPDSGNSPFFFQLRAGGEEKLPPLDYVYPVLRKRPGATVLLETVKQRNPYGNWIVMAEHTVGRGRVLFIGSDTLWKWHTLASTNEGPTPYTIFWQQAFRALTPTRSQLGAINLWLTPSRSRAEAGTAIVIQADVQSNRSLPPSNVQAQVLLPDDKRLPLVFSADPGNPRLFRAEFAGSQPGLHRISASLHGEGKLLTEGSTSFQIEDPRGEQDDQGIDHANLTRIAQATGGRVVDPTSPETWPTPGDIVLPRMERSRTIDLWSNYTLMLVLCALLAADWFIRLFQGLVAG